MSVQISYKNIKSTKNSTNLVLFIDEKFNFLKLKKYVSPKEYSFISDLLKSKDLKKRIISFDISSKKELF